MIAMRKDLCKLQDAFSVFVKEKKLKLYNIPKKPRLLLLLCLGFVLNTVFAYLGIMMRLPVSKESRPGYWALSIAFKICHLFFPCCVLQAMMLYLQLSGNVIKSIQEIWLDCRSKKKVFESTVELMKGLKITSKFLSWFCFYLTVLFISILIFHVYLFVDYLMSHSFKDIIMPLVSDIGNIVAPTLVLWILNSQSEELQQSLKDLKENIQNSEVDPTNLVEINGAKHDEKYARKIVVKMLDEFNGFDAIGFFNLGKPLLLSIAIKAMEIVFVLISLNLSMK